MFKLTLSSSEYSALGDIYGPPQEVHYMIMCASFTDDLKKWTLEGEFETFDELWATIEQELLEDFCKRKHIRALQRVMAKIEKEVWAKKKEINQADDRLEF
jgi:hypothetical protein